MEYSSSFKDNINAGMFNQISKNILNWIKENRTEERTTPKRRLRH